MGCRLLLIACLLFAHVLKAQQSPAVIDSFKAQLSRATTSEQRIDILGPLAMTLMNTNITEADKYGALLNQEAELSRNRVLMVKALLLNGQRYSFFSTNKAFLQKSLDYYSRALEVARKNKLERQTAESLLSLSSLYTSIPDLDKALGFANQAFGIATNLQNDSLLVATYYSFGAVYQLKKERILALRNYLTALRLAEESKDPLLLRSCYTVLSQFYADIKEYDKAIDYSKKSAEQLQHIKNIPNKDYTAVVDLFMMGDLYMQKKDFEMSVFYYDSSIKKAEALKYYPLKMPGYRGILRQFIQAKQPQKALAYLNNSQDLKQFVANFGASHVIDNSYAAIYTQLGNFDSARYYFQKAAPGIEGAGTAAARLSFYYQYADFYNRSGDKQNAIVHFDKALALANEGKDLDWQQRIAKELDTVYASLGNFQQSKMYSNLYYSYKDSLQKLGEEKDLLQMELADEEQRQKRKLKEEEEAKTARHNIQYLGITIGIAVVFLFLVLMGAFRVSENTIKVMGFFAFILLFEFIILIADNKIHHWTHGEPLPILGIKIILIAMLLPLHHWLEHNVVAYLASRKMIIPSRKSIWKRISIRQKPDADSH